MCVAIFCHFLRQISIYNYLRNISKLKSGFCCSECNTLTYKQSADRILYFDNNFSLQKLIKMAPRRGKKTTTATKPAEIVRDNANSAIAENEQHEKKLKGRKLKLELVDLNAKNEKNVAANGNSKAVKPKDVKEKSTKQKETANSKSKKATQKANTNADVQDDQHEADPIKESNEAQVDSAAKKRSVRQQVKKKESPVETKPIAKGKKGAKKAVAEKENANEIPTASVAKQRSEKQKLKTDEKPSRVKSKRVAEKNVENEEVVLPNGNTNENVAVAKKRNVKATEKIEENLTSKAKPKTTARGGKKSKEKPQVVDSVVENEDPIPILASNNVTKRQRKINQNIEAAVSANQNPPNNELVTKRKRGAVKPIEVVEDTENSSAKATKRKANDIQADDESKKMKKAIATAKEIKPKANSTHTDYSKINFGTDKTYNLKICSWNVAGLRALALKDGFEYFEYENPDIICLQEIKCLETEVPPEAKLKGYHPYWFSKPGGRGGVAIYSKIMPYNVDYGIANEEMDEEGRIITAEYEKFYLVCVYVPNAGNKLVTLPRRLRWNKLFEKHLTALNVKKPVIICGDMNVAHSEIDLANPKTNTKNAGFTKEERDGMTDLLALGFTDAFRFLHPKVEKEYTFWSYRGNARAKNVGWRLDYCITSQKLNNKIVDCFMRPEVLGSDHCPINLLLNI